MIKKKCSPLASRLVVASYPFNPGLRYSASIPHTRLTDETVPESGVFMNENEIFARGVHTTQCATGRSLVVAMYIHVSSLFLSTCLVSPVACFMVSVAM